MQNTFYDSTQILYQSEKIVKTASSHRTEPQAMLEGTVALNHTEAKLRLGDDFYEGLGVRRNEVEVFKCYGKTVEQGNADLQYKFGIMFKLGQGVPQNLAKALEWFGKAAEQGHADAQFSLGSIYNLGQGVPQNLAKAFEWCNKAAKQGHAGALLALALYYKYGLGVQKNESQAIKLYSLSANMDLSGAQFELGLWLTQQGKLTEALPWLLKAHENGVTQSKLLLPLLELGLENSGLMSLVCQGVAYELDLKSKDYASTKYKDLFYYGQALKEKNLLELKLIQWLEARYACLLA